MKHSHPSFEAIKPNIGSSFTSLKFLTNENIKSHVWHYHPEIELIYVCKGSGKRQIGSNISYFSDGDLVLIGSNLPHCGLTNENTNNEYEMVIQFKPDFLGEAIWETPEMQRIVSLLEKSKAGIVFGDTVKKEVGKKILDMHDSSSLDRLIRFLGILDELAVTQDCRILNAGKYYLQTQVEDNDRINVIFNYVKDHFREQMTLEEIADLANMKVPSFCRYFKKITNKTFTQFVNEYRITHSLKLLAEQPLSITEVCFESGFNNFSYFNKTFKEYVKKSPSQYRKEFNYLIE
ncbi:MULTISPECIES: AraC family transcriptional regulator [Chryseobacterium]|uniref:AraC-like DNA-binding protein n=1 Tax=Chryseobacterium camelliae TaxID=1265445 RepID=A0ABU0TGE0_9FLAO|nr:MULTISPECIES: AraC family transcriptional regulator [Chryseobacterium]MDT3406092.1 AraC-like DNA-binding protein [Pseudacidovorax intermedius]MDQ1096107.1 AraC-like DNA-binding protein [Chryseobacterium camelliae]MDQ1100043.1 AraC-like DNA-binding protein [Chryseobacterium sp. SORGH_AS_1048]MDR6087386.1 AraC-like DNA-binding protein [Chryseobacterium sp. SORGH_AS_0909]MDR6131761.1 AraC-like DNA-binding protein [Chryseobacterium sp. SORGH_AS_1175]